MFVWKLTKVTNTHNSIKYNNLTSLTQEKYDDYVALFGNANIIVEKEHKHIGFYDNYEWMPAKDNRKFKTQSAETQVEPAGATSTTIIASTRMEDSPEEAITYGKISNLPLVGKKFFSGVNYLVGRPFHIATIPWTSTQPMGTILHSAKIPLVLQTIRQFINVAKFYAYFRPDLELVIKVNGTPMHYGRVMAAYGYPISLPSVVPYLEANAYAYTNQPWVALSANTVQTANLAIPYLSTTEYLPTSIFSDVSMQTNIYQYAELKLYVAVPLAINGDGNPSIDISLYIVVKDAGFSGLSAGFEYAPAPPAVAKRQFTAEMASAAVVASAVLEVGSEAIEKAQSGVLLSDITYDLSCWFDKFKSIKYIGLPARGISKVARLGSNLLAMLGFNSPADVTKNTPIYYRNQRLLQADDIPMSIPLAPTPSPYVVKDPTFIGAAFDDYDITAYCAHFMLMDTVKIQSTMNTGTIIAAYPIRPEALAFRETLAHHELIIPTRMCYLSRFFNYWRGSIRMHLSFVASRFHSMRVRITWIMSPHLEWFAEGTTHHSEEFLNSFPSILLDINGDSDITFTIPYHQPTEWLNVPDLHYGGYNADFPAENGFLLVTVVNALISNDTTSPPGITMQTFVAAGPDFQLAQPSLTTDDANGIISRTEEDVAARRFTTQSYDGFSSDSLKHADAKPLAQYGSGSTNENLYMSTNIRSLKHLMNMGGPTEVWKYGSDELIKITITLPFDTNSFLYDGEDAFNTQLLRDNYLFNVLPLKAYMRGGYRVMLIGNTRTPVNATLKYTQVTNSTNNHFKITHDLATDILDYSSEGVHFWKQYFDSSIQVDVPYYGISKATETRTILLPGTELPRTVAILEFRFPYTANTPLSIYVSAADDTMFSYDLPMPYIYIVSEPPPPPSGSITEKQNNKITYKFNISNWNR